MLMRTHDYESHLRGVPMTCDEMRVPHLMNGMFETSDAL